MIYVAFVSHDDELDMIPLGWDEDVKQAVKLCYIHAKENNDIIEQWNWDTNDHTRINGEFWQVRVRNQHKAEYTYYVRPLHRLSKQINYAK